jgi:hypothetical protein
MTGSRLRWARLALIVVVAGVAVAGYIVCALRLGGIGFPLDDAWIHQTYARNLVERGQWAFVPGQPSAGSTSPLWALLEAPAALLGVSPVLWSGMLGVVTLALTAWLGGAWVLDEGESRPWWFWLAIIGLAFEWHLLWAALSGMETLLLGFSALAILYGMHRMPDRALLWGALVGLTVWIRPDGLSLGLAFAWLLVLGETGTRIKVVRLAWFGLGAACLVVPYLGFNYVLSGQIWPNTFYAKQAEYAILRQTPLLSRLAAEFVQPLVGPGAVLLPGLVVWVVDTVRSRRWVDLAPVIWAGSYLVAYALRLPVTYQHGRYAMPTVPAWIVLGMLGTLRWIDLDGEHSWRRITSRAWISTWLVVTAAFWLLGARAYARDAAIINSEMVQTSKWLNQHTQPGDLIAAHDIGALGYFGDRPILDLAGLVNPEVIPFIRDEKRLAAYVSSRHAAYLMTFPGWYPQLTEGKDPVYTSREPFSPEAGGENMAVYRWPR